MGRGGGGTGGKGDNGHPAAALCWRGWATGHGVYGRIEESTGRKSCGGGSCDRRRADCREGRYWLSLFGYEHEESRLGVDVIFGMYVARAPSLSVVAHVLACGFFGAFDAFEVGVGEREEGTM